MENDASAHRDGFPTTWLCYDAWLMAEAFVDLLYRGLPLGSRARMTQFEAQHAYVELPAPMPVGTAISIQAEGSPIAATVVEIVEQTAGSERPPGMRIRAVLDADAKRTWWTEASGNPAVLDGAAVVKPEPAVATTFEVKPEAKIETKPAAKIETKPAAELETEPAAELETEPAAELEEARSGGATQVMPAMTESGILQTVSEDESTSATSSASVETASAEVSGVVEVPGGPESTEAPEAPNPSDTAPRSRGKRKKPNRR
jgi:hypothetical protein